MKKIYESPELEVINLAAMERIALIPYTDSEKFSTVYDGAITNPSGGGNGGGIELPDHNWN